MLLLGMELQLIQQVDSPLLQTVTRTLFSHTQLIKAPELLPLLVQLQQGQLPNLLRLILPADLYLFLITTQLLCKHTQLIKAPEQLLLLELQQQGRIPLDFPVIQRENLYLLPRWGHQRLQVIPEQLKHMQLIKIPEY